jgi:hypothetical protein
VERFRVNVAFLVTRLNFLKHLAGLIEEAGARDMDVTILCDQSGLNTPRKGPKSYDFAYVEAIPHFRNGAPRVIAFQSTDELVRRLEQHRVDVLFSPLRVGALDAVRADRRMARLFIAQIQSVPNPNVLTDTTFFDAVYGFSPSWVRWTTEWLTHERRLSLEESRRFEKDLEAVYVPTGFAEAEQLRYIDRDSVRARLGLPARGPIVLYLPFPFESVSHYGDFWPKRIYARARLLQYANVLLSGRREFLEYARHGWNDRRVIETIRRFCDRNGATLVVKSRLKTPVRRYVRRLADRVFYDDAYHPATILELLAAADLCIHFYSAAQCEAVYAGTPAVCVSPTAEEWPAYGRRKILADFSTAPGAFYNWDGVSYSVGVPELIERFGACTLADFPLRADRRRAFIERFLGPDDLGTASRILADVASRLGRS